jgi:putative DNA primase/helicase
MTAPLHVMDGGDPSRTAFRVRWRRTDTGNAERFVDQHGANVRYLPAWKQWLVWDGKRWKTDGTFQVHRLAKDTVRAIYLDVAKMTDESEKRDWVKHAMQSEADRSIRAMLQRVMAEPGIAIVPDQLDADPWLLAVENGVIDLRTGTLQPHDRTLLMTKLVPAVFDPEARCERWESFLHRVMGGNRELIAFLQRAVGYSLTGSTGERCLLFLYGVGANGKSTFLEVLRSLLAEYAQQADFTTFLERKGDGPRNDVARLFGARVVTSSEVGEGKRLNESLVKTLTGNDTVTARFLHAEFFEFSPTFKLWLAANHRPVIRGTDNAIWGRVRLVPFTVAIPEEERDQDLKRKLLTELPGILAWAVAGCLLWLEQGLGMPQAVLDATESYRRESDTLGAFIEDCCELLPSNREIATRSMDLYSVYKRWADDGGEYALSLTAFGRQLEERGIQAEKRGTGNARVKWRVGIRLTVPLFPEPRTASAGAGPGLDDEQRGIF